MHHTTASKYMKQTLTESKGKIVNIILNGERLKAFPLRSGMRQGSHFYHYYSTLYWKFYLQKLGKRKKYKTSKLQREKIKLSLFLDDMIL